MTVRAETVTAQLPQQTCQQSAWQAEPLLGSHAVNVDSADCDAARQHLEHAMQLPSAVGNLDTQSDAADISSSSSSSSSPTVAYRDEHPGPEMHSSVLQNGSSHSTQHDSPLLHSTEATSQLLAVHG